MVFCAPWGSSHESLLDSWVYVSIFKHIVEPPALQDRGEDLTNTRRQCNWPEIGGGEGEEPDFVRLITASISSATITSVTNSVVGA